MLLADLAAGAGVVTGGGFMARRARFMGDSSDSWARPAGAVNRDCRDVPAPECRARIHSRAPFRGAGCVKVAAVGIHRGASCVGRFTRGEPAHVPAGFRHDETRRVRRVPTGTTRRRVANAAGWRAGAVVR